jgi:uncharacterized membrane protein
MTARSWALSDDLSTAAAVVVLCALALSFALLVFELGARQRGGLAILLTGVLAMLALAAAVLRPVRVDTRGSLVGPRVVVLVDQSRRLLLPEAQTTRRKLALDAVEQIRRRFSDARLSVLGFGQGPPTPLDLEARPELSVESDLVAAIAGLTESPSERPQAVVIVSDGRLSRPASGADEQALRASVGALGVPLHTVAVTERAPRDASVRAVRAAGAAVAHQPLALTIEVGCGGGLACGDIPVSVRELRQGADPFVLASGVAKLDDGKGTVELRITLERAGARVVEVAIDAPAGDEIPENDRRILTFAVARERIRLLHVAGRPTYDVRALRTWLKADESIDLVAFFILRTDEDDPGTDDDSELALIPFPVDELFTEHLPSFDAVILQDIDAERYKLARHLPALARYVESGGGLILVGGPSAFVGGSYAGTAIDRVLPVELPEEGQPSDTAEFAPALTEAGRYAPVLRPLRELLSSELPEMPGTNTLGAARQGAIVLWQHPRTRLADGKEAMPVLALGEAGDGRSIALGVDGTWKLAWSELAADIAGRSYGALWEGLLGWLMRDPRYESARIDVVGDCHAGEPVTLRLTRLPGTRGEVKLVLEKLAKAGPRIERTIQPPPEGPIEVTLEPLEAGGWAARASIGEAPATRFDFACEKGGPAWADSRPDPDRLEGIARATKGRAVARGRVGDLPLPDPTPIAAERHVSPILPAWLWTLAASVLLGAHWIARRRGGLA